MVRIASNYIRLACTLMLGLALVPVLLRWLGETGFGVVALLGSSVGIANLFQVLIHRSLIRELGVAYHAETDEGFRDYVGMTWMLAAATATLAFLAFVLVAILLRFFQIPEELLGSARVFVLAQGAYSASYVLLSPTLTSYLVREQWVGHSVYFSLLRASNLGAALFLWLVIGVDRASGLAWYGVLHASTAVLILVVASAIAIARDPRLRPRFRVSSELRRSEMKTLLKTFGWNTTVHLSLNLNDHAPAFILNLFFGPLGNAMWGVAFRLAMYIRMATTGMTFGSDAMSVRVSSDDDDTLRRAGRLFASQGRLAAMVAMPGAAIVLLYAWPVFDLWIGRDLQSYDTIMPAAVLTVRILAIGLLGRAIAEGWMSVLYGAGFVHRYAPVMLTAGLITPLVGIAMIYLLPGTRGVTAGEAFGISVVGPALALVAIFGGIYLLYLPRVAARCLHLPLRDSIGPLLRPVLLTAICCVVSLAAAGATDGFADLPTFSAVSEAGAERIRPLSLLIPVAVFSLVYAILAPKLVLEQRERDRLWGLTRGLRKRVRLGP